MNNLASDNLIDVLSKLDSDELAQLCTTNKEFSQHCQNERVWETLTKRKFGAQVKNYGSWYNTYQSFIRPIYTVTIYGDLIEKVPISKVFYSLDAALNFLMNDEDIMNQIQEKQVLDLKKYGYSDLFIKIVEQGGFDGLKDELNTMQLLLDCNPDDYDYTQEEIDSLESEIDKFGKEFKSILEDFFSSHHQYSFGYGEHDIAYVITETTVTA